MEMNELMMRAREMQTKVGEAQELLASSSVKGISGAGLVIVELSGKYDLLKLTLSPELLKQSLVEITDLISLAFKDAKEKADALIDKVMGAATEGMPIPE
ncbi:MAG: YbaB/EbfC family nucleoid-associated protein [Rickettsiales bacterium]|jgi:DNA-binding YbaB/EbfC family protein|nr:YbaB/EbfC family nucleoid-associated protein [Rickettsiales bacterium]